MLNLVKVLYGHWEKPRTERERSQSHYPSGVPAIVDGKHMGKCRRQLWYQLKGEVQSDPPDAVAFAKMDMGDQFHDMYSAVLEEELLEFLGEYTAPEGSEVAVLDSQVVRREVPVRFEIPGLKLPISGRIDTIFQQEGKKYGVEWKSSYGQGIRSIQKGEMKEEHIFQCLCYLENPVEKLEGIYLIYIAKDSGFLYGFYLYKQDEEVRVHFLNSDTGGTCSYRWKHILEGLKSVEKSLKSKAPPAPDYKPKITSDGKIADRDGDWQCRYCSYARLCWGLI